MMEFKPYKLSEANIQAELYMACKVAGIECSLEYRSYWNEVREKGKKGSRFDAVIVREHKIIAIIEIKSTNNPKGIIDYWPHSRAFKKYSSFGVPVFLITSKEEIPDLLAKLGGL